MTDNINETNKAASATERASFAENKDFESQQPQKGADRGAQLIGDQRIVVTEEDVSTYNMRASKL